MSPILAFWPKLIGRGQRRPDPSFLLTVVNLFSSLRQPEREVKEAQGKGKWSRARIVTYLCQISLQIMLLPILIPIFKYSPRITGYRKDKKLRISMLWDSTVLPPKCAYTRSRIFKN